MLTLTCKDIADLCTDFEEGTLSWGTWVDFRMHLLLCGPCKEYVRQMGLTAQILGDLPPEDLSPELRSDLAERFRSWHAGHKDDD